jgi:hypothetical protein
MQSKRSNKLMNDLFEDVSAVLRVRFGSAGQVSPAANSPASSGLTAPYKLAEASPVR